MEVTTKEVTTTTRVTTGSLGACVTVLHLLPSGLCPGWLGERTGGTWIDTFRELRGGGVLMGETGYVKYCRGKSYDLFDTNETFLRCSIFK